MELLVFDLALNNVGLIDEFIECKFEIHYTRHSQLTLIVDASKDNISLLQEDMIITKTKDLTKGFIIKHFEYMDDASSRILIIAPSINILLNDRIILGQQSFNGNIEDVMKSFVRHNAVNPLNPNRIIPNLNIAANSGININTTEAISDEKLDEYSYELANKYDMTWDILLDHENKKFYFTTWQGKDKSSEQNVNPAVTFSKELDNIIRQEYVKDDLSHRTVAIVAGEGEGINRTYLTVNDQLSGYARKEIFVDARDLQSTYKDENDVDVTLTALQYQGLLTERGNNKLTEYQPIRTFESEIDLYSQFVYGIDFFVGDKISIENEDIGIVMHTRIISARELYTKDGDQLQLDFGSNVPTLIDSIKRMVK